MGNSTYVVGSVVAGEVAEMGYFEIVANGDGSFKASGSQVVPPRPWAGDFLIGEDNAIYVVLANSDGKVKALKTEGIARWDRIGSPTLPDGIPSPENDWTWEEKRKRWRKALGNGDANPERHDFEVDLKSYYGIETHPKRTVLYRIAWDYGHGTGYYEVLNVADTLIELIQE